MIRYCFLFYLGCLTVLTHAQSGLYINGNAANLIVPNGNFISVQGDFVNQNCDPVNKVRFAGSLFLTNNLINNDSLVFSPELNSPTKQCRLILIGNATCSIYGNAVPQFWEVEMNKGIGNRVDLFTDIICRDTLDFKSGFIYMNHHKWNLKDPVGANIMNHPWIKNERNGSQFLGANSLDTGKVVYQTIYTNSVNINPGNIGLQINGLLNISSPLKIIRGFSNQLNSGKGSLAKYFDIYSSGHKLVNNTLSVSLFLNESAGFAFNYLNLPSLKAYVSPITDFDYTPIASNFTTAPLSLTNVNTTMTVNLIGLRHPNMRADSNSFRITFADPNCLNPPLSMLGADTVHICSGDSLLLDAGNSTIFANTNLRYEWNTALPAYTRTLLVKPNAAHQKYKLSLMDIRGCQIHDSVVVAPTAPYPIIKYFNHLNACFGDSITIKDTVAIASGSFSNSYSFSDNSLLQTNSQLFRKKMASIGTSSVQLTITSNYGCSVVATRTNMVTYPNPTAAFSYSMNCINRQISFYNQSTSNFTQTPLSFYQWMSGSIITSSVPNPTQTFSTSGSYSIQLKVTTAVGCKDSTMQMIQIYPNNIASFTKSNVCDGDTVQFMNASSCLTGSCNLNWEFGDNTSDTTQQVKKIYSGAGLYYTKLIVTAKVGCPDSISVPVFIHPNPTASFSTNLIAYCPNDQVYTLNSSSISIGNISQINWTSGTTNLGSSWNVATQFPFSGFFPFTLQVISDSGCVSMAVSNVSIHPEPQALLITSNVCSGDSSSFYSAIQNPNWQYIYDFGNASPPISSNLSQQKYLYTQSGTYTPQLVILNSYGCSDTSAVTHTVMQSPIAPFTNSISTCGDDYLLDAGNPGSSYQWIPSNIGTQTLNCTSTGLYQIIITATNGCNVTDQVYLKLNSKVLPFLGNDTIVCGSLLLNAGYPGSQYNWNTGQTTPIITAAASGNYIVTVTDQNSCQGSDTIFIQTKTKPLINLGPDQTLCKPKNGLALQITSSAGTYSWNTGSSSMSVIANSSGFYWATVTATNGCKSSDTVKIQFLNTPLVNLGGSKFGCDKIILDAFNSGKSFQWSTGATTQTASIETSGKVWVQVMDIQTQCAASDTSFIQIEKRPRPILGPDTNICENIVYVLNSSNTNGTVRWNSGETTNTLEVKAPGLYGVTVTGPLGCMGSDYVTITIRKAPIVELGASIQYLCGDHLLVLKTDQPGTYQWTKNNQAISSSSVVTISTPDKYVLSVSNNGCISSDSAQVVHTSNTVQAQFLASTIDTVNTSVQFVNLSQPQQVTSKWSFGDGTESSLQDPEHTWLVPQNFNVSLEVSNGFCVDKLTKSLNVIFRDHRKAPLTAPNLQLLTCVVFPNPTNNEVKLVGDFNHYTNCEFYLIDLSGKILQVHQTSTVLHLEKNFELKTLANGNYYLKIIASSAYGEIQKTFKILKQQ